MNGHKSKPLNLGKERKKGSKKERKEERKKEKSQL